MSKDAPQGFTITVPFRIRRRGGGRTVRGGVEAMAPLIAPGADVAQVTALARAFRWKRMLDEGVYSGVIELAKAEKVDPAYVSRLLKLTMATPSEVERVLNGDTQRLSAE